MQWPTKASAHPEGRLAAAHEGIGRLARFAAPVLHVRAGVCWCVSYGDTEGAGLC